MCLTGRPFAAPSSAAEAVEMARTALGWLAAADAASLPASVQADCLRGLEQAAALHTAARSSVLTAFTAQAGYEDDGHGSARTWLKWQTRVSGASAAATVGWARRMAAHPAIGAALARAEISVSWARCLCGWSDQLPKDARASADEILLAAAAGGADLADLAALAQEILARTAGPDADGDGFADRWVRLDRAFSGHGSLAGDLTPACTAALEAVIGALGKKCGPEDVRSRGQRDHDALEEACRLLIAAGFLPARAGQPTLIQLHMTLDQLTGGGSGTGTGSSGGTTSGTAGPAQAGSPAGAPAPPGADCDASIVPVVTGHVDPHVLDALAARLLRAVPRSKAAAAPGWPAGGAPDDGCAAQAAASPGARPASASPGHPGLAGGTWLRAQRAARNLVLREAADVLSGPRGLASLLRTGLGGLAGSVSLPLDIGTATETIPVHLRRAVTVRDPQCRFPGCDQPAVRCQPHHIIPRAQGGPTSLANLINLCCFHHLVAVHRWGWSIALHPDGTVTATSPEGQRTLRSHSPPATAA